MAGMSEHRQRRNPQEWLPVAAQVIRDANERVITQAAYGAYEAVSAATGDHGKASKDHDAVKRRAANLSVRVGPAATRGTGAPAFYDQDTREVVLDSDVALPGVDPATVRWSQEGWRRKHLRAAGLVEHEVGHAAHSDTRWFKDWQKAGADVLDFGTMLEETRMESRVVQDGGDRQALAAVAHELILRDAHVDEQGDAWRDAMGAVLILGRDQGNGGALPSSSVKPFRDAYAAKHGAAWVQALDDLIRSYNATQDRDVPQRDAMRDLMERWKTELGAAAPEPDGEQPDGGGEGEQQGGDQGGGGEQSQPDTSDASAGDVGDTKDAGDGGDQVGELEPGDQEQPKSIRDLLRDAVDLSEQEQREAVDAADQAEQAEDAEQVRQIVHGQDESAFGEAIQVTPRHPEAQDRKLASELARHFQQLALPEVARTRVRAQLPPGRMIGRGAVTRQAQKASGQVVNADLFRHQRKQVTTTPPPVIGLMTDCSGSMREAQPHVARLAWALSEAGRAIQARTALVAFGTTAQLVEHDRSHVQTAHASHGWENFSAGFKTLDDRLHLTSPYRGARVLIIASDGGFGRVQGATAAPTVRHLERRGVAVVWAAIGCNWKGYGRGIDAGHVLELDASSTPSQIAHAMTDAVEQAMRAARISF